MCTPQTAWNHCVEFHGHSCHGLAIGYRVALAALDQLDLSSSKDEETICVAENDACGVDAVQVITGCTLGKGNLLYYDNGRQVYNFFNRRGQRRIRIIFNNQIKTDQNWDRKQLQNYILNAPEEEILTFSEPFYGCLMNLCNGRGHSIVQSILREQYGENASEHKIR